MISIGASLSAGYSFSDLSRSIIDMRELLLCTTRDVVSVATGYQSSQRSSVPTSRDCIVWVNGIADVQYDTIAELSVGTGVSL